MSFKVFVDDNYHYQDPSERYEKGVYSSFETAVSVCKNMVDQFLMTAFKEGMSASELYDHYTSFGPDPFVVPIPEGATFSAWDYAKQRCAVMCHPAWRPEQSFRSTFSEKYLPGFMAWFTCQTLDQENQVWPDWTKESNKLIPGFDPPPRSEETRSDEDQQSSHGEERDIT